MALPAVSVNPAGVTLVGSYIAAIIRALEARGIAMVDILKAAGVEQVPLNDPLTRVPLASLRGVLDAAVELTRDPYIGLYAARFLHATNLHALGFAMLASGSLRELLRRLTRYYRFLSGNAQPEVVETDDDARLEFILTGPSPPLSGDVFGLFLVNLIRELSDGKIGPIRVEMHRAAPPDSGIRHSDAFGCPVHFGFPYTSIVFNRSALDIPFNGGSSELAEYNERIVVTYLAKLERNDIRMRVRALLLQDLPAGGVTKDGIAKKLFMSPRTLQVKLANNDTTFQEIVNETRFALARGYIDNSSMSITEVAYMLGFSDTSNFTRAFRRWTGVSPSAYVARRRDPEFPVNS